MKLGKVIGKIIATRKVDNVAGTKLYVVRYLDENLGEMKKTAACVDTVNANIGDIVLLCSSSSARMTQMTRYMCIDNSIVGVVETISGEKQNRYQRAL